MPYTHVNNHIKNRQRRFYFWAKYWLVFLFCNAWLTHKQTIILADLNILKPVPPSFTILLSKLVNLFFPIIFSWGSFGSYVNLWGAFCCRKVQWHSCLESDIIKNIWNLSVPFLAISTGHRCCQLLDLTFQSSLICHKISEWLPLLKISTKQRKIPEIRLSIA